MGESLPGAVALATADVDGDGKPDVLVGARTGLVVLPSTPDGNFAPGRRLLDECFVTGVVTADFNNDGVTDIAAYCTGSNTVFLLMGLGKGEFDSTRRLAVSGWNSRGILAADFNQDGIPDLAVAQFNGVAIFTGNGDGTFAALVERRMRSAVVSLASADLNADGVPDLAMASEVSSSISVLLSVGTSGFQPVTVLSDPCAGYVHGLFTADLNNDGSVDIAAACDDGMGVWMGAGDGTFRPGSKFSEDARPLSVAIADLNVDGIPDAVLGNYYDGKITVLLGKGDGTFFEAGRVSAVGDVFEVRLTDLNGDSNLDLVATSYSGSSALVAVGRGDGKLNEPIYLGILEASFLRASSAGGASDLAIFLPPRKSTYFLRRVQGPAISLAWSDYPMDARFGDFNRDGIPDLIAVTLRSANGDLGDDMGAGVFLALSRGDGKFDRPVSILTQSYPVASGIALPLLAAGEFTGDSNLDFVLSNDSTATLQVFRGNGDGSFSKVSEVTGVRALELAAADFDADGFADLAVVSMNPPTVTVYLGGAGGRFKDSKRYELDCTSPRYLLTGDFTGDSKPDLAAVCGSGLTLMVNSGAGVFQLAASQQIENASQMTAFTVADFDGDRKQDLFFARRLNSVWGGGTVLLSNGDGSFRTGKSVSLPADPIAVVAGYWDDDNLPDLAILSGLDGTVTIRHSQDLASKTETEFTNPLSGYWR